MFQRSTKSLTSAKWLGTVAGIVGALLVALNIGGTIVGVGFIFFAVSATAWVIAGWRMGQPSLVAMPGGFLASNIVGVWGGLGGYGAWALTLRDEGAETRRGASNHHRFKPNSNLTPFAAPHER